MPVTSYEPNELIITVQAGAPLADVKSLIDSKNQHFRLRAGRYHAAAGNAGGGNHWGHDRRRLAGPRRIQAGGGRDHLLGAHAVSGFGDSFKAGGRVVKNVTVMILQAVGGVVGHACGDDRGDAESHAKARKRAHPGAARPG